MCTPQPMAYPTINFLNKYCVPEVGSSSVTNVELYNSMITAMRLDGVNQWISDILLCQDVYLTVIISTVVLIFIWALLLRSIANVLAWVSIVIVGLGLLVTGILVRGYNIESYPEGLNTKTWLNIFSWVIWLCLIDYTIAILCFWHSLEVAAKVFRVSARVIMNNTRLALVTISQTIVTVTWIAMSIYFLAYLMSCGEYSKDQNGYSVYTYSGS